MDAGGLLLIIAAVVFFGFGHFTGKRSGLRIGQLIILNALPLAERESTLNRAAELLGVERENN